MIMEGDGRRFTALGRQFNNGQKTQVNLFRKTKSDIGGTFGETKDKSQQICRFQKEIGLCRFPTIWYSRDGDTDIRLFQVGERTLAGFDC